VSGVQIQIYMIWLKASLEMITLLTQQIHTYKDTVHLRHDLPICKIPGQGRALYICQFTTIKATLVSRIALICPFLLLFYYLIILFSNRIRSI
jgi:hypothetical protein